MEIGTSFEPHFSESYLTVQRFFDLGLNRTAKLIDIHQQQGGANGCHKDENDTSEDER